MARKKFKGRSERGGFSSMPDVCLTHDNYTELSAHAKVLLWDLCLQYRGFNNGDLCATMKVLGPRGWKSNGTLFRAIKELKKKGWIIVSRQGGRNQCSLYALTFHSIDVCNGKLDIADTLTPSSDWKKPLKGESG